MPSPHCDWVSTLTNNKPPFIFNSASETLPVRAVTIAARRCATIALSG